MYILHLLFVVSSQYILHIHCGQKTVYTTQDLWLAVSIYQIYHQSVYTAHNIWSLVSIYHTSFMVISKYIPHIITGQQYILTYHVVSSYYIPNIQCGYCSQYIAQLSCGQQLVYTKYTMWLAVSIYHTCNMVISQYILQL